jgi:hypothetical protein
MHRLLAALVRGQHTIDVEFCEGSAESAFLRAVEVNIARSPAVAGRSVRCRDPGHRVASTDVRSGHRAGLGAKALAAIRRRSADAAPQLNARIGATDAFAR